MKKISIQKLENVSGGAKCIYHFMLGAGTLFEA